MDVFRTLCILVSNLGLNFGSCVSVNRVHIKVSVNTLLALQVDEEEAANDVRFVLLPGCISPSNLDNPNSEVCRNVCD